jgi:deoxycytidylate deaminase
MAYFKNNNLEYKNLQQNKVNKSDNKIDESDKLNKLDKVDKLDNMEVHHDKVDNYQNIIGILKEISCKSNCLKMQASALVVSHKKIISTGFNTVLPCIKSCNLYWNNYYNTLKTHLKFEQWLLTDDFKLKHKEWSKTNEIHAETLALSHINYDYNSEYTLYTLYSPCENCALAIIFKGIKYVYYLLEYKHGKKALETLKDNSVYCIKLLQ